MPIEPPIVRNLWKANCENLSPGFATDFHLHPFHQLVIVTRGRARAEMERGGRFALPTGSALLVPPWTRHRFAAAARAQIVSFKFQVAPEYDALFGGNVRRMMLGGALAGELKAWGGRFRQPPLLAEQEALILATECLIEMARGQSSRPARRGSPPGGAPLRRVLEAVARRPFAPWSVESLAAEARLPVTQFMREFRATLRQSPRAFLHEIKLRAAAAELVDNPAQPIKVVAAKAGYATIHAFTRAFQAMFQISPGACRRPESHHLIGRTL